MSNRDTEASQAKTQPITPPPDFPVTWENPDDEHLHWTRDRTHSVGPSKPIELSMAEITMSALDEVFGERGIKRKTRTQRINAFIYYANAAPPPDPQETAAPSEEKKDEQLEQLGRLQEQWEDEWLPEVQLHLAFWAAFDLPNVTLPDLITHLDETQAHIRRLWKLHFDIVFPVHDAMEKFEKLYEELFGSDNPFGAYSLLEGFGSRTVDMGLALWHLSRQALTDDEVHRTITQGKVSDAQTRLEKSVAGRQFLAHLDEFLAEYGHRGNMWGITSPSWLEDPTPVLFTLRDYIQQPERDLDQEMAAATTRREERRAAVRLQLDGYPQAVVAQFEFLLKAAQAAIVLKEDHGFWIDFRGAHLMRCVILEFGRRFAQAGVIEERDDIFYLEWEELRATATALPEVDRKDLISIRKAEEEQFAQIEPPAELGVRPPESGTAAAKKASGAPTATDDPIPEQIRGNPGSPGVARGRVMVVRTLPEAEKLAPGDVLVAVTTAPPWTPLFAVVAAVVTDTGGMLSHCAVVAREYGIPAVVGARSASTLLRDGQIVEVDGSAGTVRVID